MIRLHTKRDECGSGEAPFRLWIRIGKRVGGLMLQPWRQARSKHIEPGERHRVLFLRTVKRHEVFSESRMERIYIT